MHYDTAVIAWGEIALANRDRVDLRNLSDPRVGLGDPAGLFNWAREWASQDEITLITDHVPGRRRSGSLIAPPAATLAMPQALQADGWATPDIHLSATTGWSSWQRTNPLTGRTETIHLGVLTMMDQPRTPLFGFGDSAERIAQNLRLYAIATGGSWRQTAGVSGCATIRRLAHEAKVWRTSRLSSAARVMEPRWRWDDHPDQLAGSGDLRLSTNVDLVLSPEDTGYIVRLDIRNMYLAAAGNAQLSFGLPTRGVRPFDQNTAGYWLIDMDQLPQFRVPQYGRPWVVDYMDIVQGRVWVTTPIMTYLNDYGTNPEIHDAWTSKTSGRLLRPWVTRLTTGRSHLEHAHPRVTDAWKRTYTETVGMMGAAGGSIYRPDWRHTISDLARTNMIRKLETAHPLIGWPFRIHVDSVWYHIDTPNLSTDALVALGVIGQDSLPQRSPGKFRVVSVEPAAEFYRRERHL